MWRTACLMRLARDLYRDEAGNIYEVERSGTTPRYLLRIPDVASLEAVLQQTCSTVTQHFLALLTGLGIVALVQWHRAHWLWLLLLVPLFLLARMAEQPLVRARMTWERTPADSRAISLERTSALAHLEAVTTVRVCAVLLILCVFVAPIAVQTVVHELAVRLPNLHIWAMVAFGIAAFRLIVDGGHVLNPDHLELGAAETA
jgi:hypothetical protein